MLPRTLTTDEVEVLAAGGGQYRRTGSVSAEVLDAALVWHSERGNVLTSTAGDWLVDDGWTTWVVEPRAFSRRYRRQVDGTYLREGTVRATCLCDDVRVLTREGLVTGRSGDWLAVGDDGDVWVISRAHFGRAYASV